MKRCDKVSQWHYRYINGTSKATRSTRFFASRDRLDSMEKMIRSLQNRVKISQRFRGCAGQHASLRHGATKWRVFPQFSLSEDDWKKYDVVNTKFDNHFAPKRNVIHERAMFNKRDQLPDESAESFIRVLYTLVHVTAKERREMWKMWTCTLS